MGIFDKFGKRSEAASGPAQPQSSQVSPQPDTAQRQEALQRKYQSVITALSREHVQLQDLRLQDNKLYMRGTAPSQTAKDRIWDEIKRINPNYDDIHVDMMVLASTGDGRTVENTTFSQIAAPVASQGTAVSGDREPRTHVVKPGDTLSRLSKQFYGDASLYTHIFNANRDKLNDPDLIKVGQNLVIPPKP